MDVNIANNQEIQEIQKSNLPMLETAKGLEVTKQEEAVKASEFVKGINDTLKNIEKKRLSFTKPINESLNAINSTFKELTIPLETAKFVITNKIMDWRRIEAEKVAKEEARRRAIQEAHAKQGHEVKAPIVMEQPKQTIGNVQVRKIWSYRITDFAKLPDKYKMINTTEVNGAVRSGLREIPGLEIFQKEIGAIR